MGEITAQNVVDEVNKAYALTHFTYRIIPIFKRCGNIIGEKQKGRVLTLPLKIISVYEAISSKIQRIRKAPPMMPRVASMGRNIVFTLFQYVFAQSLGVLPGR